MTADASGVLLTEIVNHHNGVVIGTHSAVLFGIVTIVSLVAFLYMSYKCDPWPKHGSLMDRAFPYIFVAFLVSASITVVSVFGAVTDSYELSEAIRVYESVYGPLPEGLFD